MHGKNVDAVNRVYACTVYVSCVYCLVEDIWYSHSAVAKQLVCVYSSSNTPMTTLQYIPFRQL